MSWLKKLQMAGGGRKHLTIGNAKTLSVPAPQKKTSALLNKLEDDDHGFPYPVFRPRIEFSGSCLLVSVWDRSFQISSAEGQTLRGMMTWQQSQAAVKPHNLSFSPFFLFLVPLNCDICPAGWNQKQNLFGFPTRFEYALFRDGYVFIIFTLTMNESVLHVFNHNWPSVRYGSWEWADKE